jgi:hypothetical protein
MLVHSIGAFRYKTVLGSGATVDAFGYLGEVRVVPGGGYNEYQFAPSQD